MRKGLLIICLLVLSNFYFAKNEAYSPYDEINLLDEPSYVEGVEVIPRRYTYTTIDVIIQVPHIGIRPAILIF